MIAGMCCKRSAEGNVALICFERSVLTCERNWPPCLTMGPRAGGRREGENAFPPGEVLDNSVSASIFMHWCFPSPGLTQCRSLPSQPIEALLTNVLKCRFSNIIMHSILLFTYRKKNNPTPHAARFGEPQPSRKEGRMETLVLLYGTASGREEQLWNGESFLKQPSQRKSCSFFSLML